MPNTVSFVDEETTESLTGGLRWLILKNQLVETADGEMAYMDFRPKLQQEWQIVHSVLGKGSTRKFEWRDVPTEEQ